MYQRTTWVGSPNMRNGPCISTSARWTTGVLMAFWTDTRITLRDKKGDPRDANN